MTGDTVPGAGERVDRYDRMLRLADLFDTTAEELRARSRLGEEVLRDPSVAESAELAPVTFARAEEALRAATTGEQGLASGGMQLDADALMVRATVLTYRWIDELQHAAYATLGSIAGRAVGYLAPEVALGGAVVSAGLIEADALDRDGVAAYLDELAERNPELMDHVASGGGGLLDGLRMRSLLTAGVPTDAAGRLAATAGLRAAGVEAFAPDPGSALRDVAGGLVEPAGEDAAATTADDGARAPAGLGGLMAALASSPASIRVQRVGAGRCIAYLAGPGGAGGTRLRLVGGDRTAYARQVVRAVEQAVAGDDDPRVLLVGAGPGGLAAAEVAAAAPPSFTVDQVVLAGAPAAQVPRVPAPTRVLALEDRRDPVALLGSLVVAGDTNRVTVVFDGADDAAEDEGVYVRGGRAADRAGHPELVAELDRLRAAGFLAC